MSSLLPKNVALRTFGKLLIVLLTNVYLLYLLYSMTRRCSASEKAWLLHQIKQNCLLKTFLRTLILKTQVSSISLSAFSFRTNLKLQNNSVTPKIVKKVIMKQDSSKAFGIDCMGPKNCEPELPYLLQDSSICVWYSLVFHIVERSYWWSVYLRMSR